MANDALAQKHVLITGASDGIGRALAVDVAARGARVTLAARSQAKLTEVARAITAGGGSATVVVTDVTDAASCAALVDQARARHGDIDVLVCNAGVGSASQGEATIPVDAIRRIMEVNFMGAVHTTAAALPSLRKTHGLIVAVSSLQGLLAFPGSAGYAASKHAMQGFFDSLRLDLAGAVDVLVVSPGPVATKIHYDGAPASRALSATKVAQRSMPVERCAALITDAIAARRRELVMTFGGRLAVKLYPFVPGFVDTQVARASRRFYS